MKRHVVALAIALCLPASFAVAHVAGTASGIGTMSRSVPGKTAGPQSETNVAVDFYPHFSFAAREGDEQRGGQEGQSEAQDGEQQRRQHRDRHLDDDEIAAPDRDHGEREQQVGQGQSAAAATA